MGKKKKIIIIPQESKLKKQKLNFNSNKPHKSEKTQEQILEEQQEIEHEKRFEEFRKLKIIQEEQKRILLDPSEPKPKVEYSDSEEQPDLYGEFLEYKDTDVKFSKSEFQENLKEFYDVKEDLLIRKEEQKIKNQQDQTDLQETQDILYEKLDQPESIDAFNRLVKTLMTNRNKNLKPQAYKKIQKEEEKQKVKTININIVNRNQKVTSKTRGNIPVKKGIRASSNR